MNTGTAHKDISAVLREVDTTLDMARLALEDFLHGDRPPRRLAGLRNVVVWGRAVTNVLQNVRTFDRERFDKWYAPRQAEMRDRPDFKYLVQLRNQLLKEGVLGGISGSMHIEFFNTNQIAELPRPAGATGFFMGDQLGGSGWIVKLADGTEERFYVELPTHWRMKTQSHFSDVTTDLGIPAPTKPIDELLIEYVEYLRALVADASSEFGA